MAFGVILFLLVICYGETVLNSYETWNDDFIFDEDVGINGWSKHGKHFGMNTTNIYHGFYSGFGSINDMTGNLYRIFKYNNNQINSNGYCHVSFNVVFGCQPDTTDGIIFTVQSNIAQKTLLYKEIMYSESYPYSYLYDDRIYYGNSTDGSDPQCNANNLDALHRHGGYSVKYSGILNIINYQNNIQNEPFKVIFLSNFNSNDNRNEYYGIYNFKLYCQPYILPTISPSSFPTVQPTGRMISELQPISVTLITSNIAPTLTSVGDINSTGVANNAILYKKSWFIMIPIFDRFLGLWVFGGVLFVLICVFMCIPFNTCTKNRTTVNNDYLKKSLEMSGNASHDYVKKSDKLPISQSSLIDFENMKHAIQKVNPNSLVYPRISAAEQNYINKINVYYNKVDMCKTPK